MTPRNKIIPIFVPHAGCPNQCVFCNQRRISGSLHPASAENVRQILSSLAGTGYEVAFYGGSFTAIEGTLQEELLSSLSPWRENGTVTAIRCSTRPDAIDPVVIERLKRYDVKTVELGSQSMNDEVLRLSQRGHTAEDTVKAVRLLKKNGFKVVLQMMTGLPGETKESAVSSAEKIISLAPDAVRIYPTVLVKDTPLADMWRAGEYKEHTVEDAVEVCAEILPLFSNAGIPVIRLGLNPTDELTDGAALGGAYHPALGELVFSRIYRNKAENVLQNIHLGGCAAIKVSPREVSKMTGQHRCNILWLKERFGLKELSVIPDASVPAGELKAELLQ